MKVETTETLEKERERLKKIIRQLLPGTKEMKEVFKQLDECTTEVQMSNVYHSFLKRY